MAHFAVDVFVDNSLANADGEPMRGRFDGHANCFIEAGDGRAPLIDFNYDTEPLPGTYPLPAVGPFRLLSPTVINHWGKLAFRWVYWHALLAGRSRCRRTCRWLGKTHRQRGVRAMPVTTIGTNQVHVDAEASLLTTSETSRSALSLPRRSAYR